MRSGWSNGIGGPVSLPDTELQADVMRFVAILALCLVAISTLVERSRHTTEEAQVVAVQSSPEASVTETPDPAQPVDSAVPVVDPPVAAPDPGPAAASPTRRSQPVRTPANLPRTMPSARIEQDPPPRSAESRPAISETPRQGLQLRFESDAALLRMVSRGDAAVFVVTAEGVRRLDVRRGIDFIPAPAPGSYYRMAPETVPALLRASYPGPDDAQWGVTLPEPTVTSLRGHLAEGGGGLLVIDADGGVTRESDDG